MSRRRDWLIQDSRSLPVDAASRALRGDVAGSAAAQEPGLRLLAAEIAGMFERAGPLVRGASEVVAWSLEAIAARGENCLKRGDVGEAVALLSTLGVGICAGYDKIWDEESEVGLGPCRPNCSSAPESIADEFFTDHTLPPSERASLAKLAEELRARAAQEHHHALLAELMETWLRREPSGPDFDPDALERVRIEAA